MLSGEDYSALLNKKSVSNIVDYLLQTSYREAFKDADIKALHRGDIEVLLKRYAVDLMMKLGHFFHGADRKFLKILCMRFEVEDLKVLIRAIYTDREYIATHHPLIYLDRYGSLEFVRLAKASSFLELVTELEGTEYYPYLKPLVSADKREDQFLIEMALDLSYISMYKKYVKHLSTGEQKLVKKIQGMRADLQNLQWIYRGMKFYHLPPEILLNYTVQFGGRLGFDEIKDLCYSSDAVLLEEKMASSRYRFLFEHRLTKDIFMERRIYRYQYNKLRQFKQMSGLDIMHTLVYFHLLEYEIRDIISIIENIRYHNEDEEQLKRCLIRSL